MMFGLRFPFVLLALAASAAGMVEKTAAPAWVAPIQLEMGRPYDADASRNGIRYHLVEYQSVANEVVGTYRRIAYEITTREAVGEYSSLSFDYAPGDQKLALHRLDVIRNGEIQNRLPDQEIRILQRENSLENNLYDGRNSAHLLLEDIRVGDVIDYAISIEGGNPTLGGKFFQNWALEFSRPIGRMFVRHLGAPDRPFFHRAHITDLEPEIRDTAAGREFIWDQYDVSGTRHESDAPSWYFAYPTLEMGEFDEWGEVVEWALPLYDFDQELPEELQEAAAAWRELPPEERIVDALRFVQDEVRYVAMALGPHSYQPYPIGQIWSRKFGDCKDKSLLLVALLRHAGIADAWPALVETDFGKILTRTLPSPRAFDHVIVYVRHGGEDYWLEPTDSRQEGPLEQIFCSDHGHALVIRPGETALRETRPQGYEHSRTEIDEHFVVPAYGAPVEFRVVTRFFGADADHSRASFQRNALVERGERYVSFYRKTYPGLRQLALPATEDDTQANIFTVRESYEIDDFFTRSDDGSAYECLLTAAAIDDARTTTGNTDRATPHKLSHPSHMVQTLRLTLPGPGEFADYDKDLKNPSAIYQQRLRHEGDTLVIRHEYRTLRDHIAPEDLADFRKMTDEIYQITDYPISVPARFFGHVEETPVEAAEETPTDSDSAWLFVWAAMLGMVTLLVGILVSVALIFVPFWRNQPPRPYNPNAPTGMGGWLVLLAIGVSLGPLVAIYQMVEVISAYNAETVALLTNIRETPHVWWWLAILSLEFGFVIFMLPVSVAVIFLFFSQRRIFPVTHIVSMITGVVVSGVVNLGGYQLNPDGFDEAISPRLIGGLIGTALWTLYLLMSVRVRNTFIRIPGVRVAPPPLPAPGGNPQ